MTSAQVGAGEQVLGVLPSNAAVLTSSAVWVTTAFNGTTPVVNVGIAGTPAMFASAMTLAAAASLPFDDVALAAAVPAAASRNCVCTLTGTTVTTGSCEVIVNYAIG